MCRSCAECRRAVNEEVQCSAKRSRIVDAGGTKPKRMWASGRFQRRVVAKCGVQTSLYVVAKGERSRRVFEGLLVVVSVKEEQSRGAAGMRQRRCNRVPLSKIDFPTIDKAAPLERDPVRIIGLRAVQSPALAAHAFCSPRLEPISRQNFACLNFAGHMTASYIASFGSVADGKHQHLDRD